MSFTANSVTKAAVLPEGRSSTLNSGTKVSILLGMNRCNSFPLLSAPYSLFSIWKDFKWSEKILGAPMWKWGEWILLTGSSELDRNSPEGLNISSIRVFDQIRDQEIQAHFAPICRFINNILNIFGGEGWFGFPDLWCGQKPWWNSYLTPVVNFGEVRRTQLAKSTHLTSSLVPLGSFQIF